MSHALSNEVVELNNELEKSVADLQIIVDEVKDDFQKQLEQFDKIQSFQTERIDKIEDVIKTEVQNLKKLSDNLGQILDEHGHRLKELGQLQEQVSLLSKVSPEKLREELIGGIRMLGERVSKAIADINERIDNFTDEIHAKVNNVTGNSYKNAEGASAQEGDDFASIKESKLLDVNDFEIVPREAIKRLTELFKKQSSAVKSFIGNHEKKIQDFEQLLKTYDDENTRLLELLDRRVKRNFLISMAAIIFVILCSIAMRVF